MGDYRNGRIFNVIAGLTVLATSALSITLLVVTLGRLVLLVRQTGSDPLAREY